MTQIEAAVEIDAARQAILLDLIEHEAQHHGQLIRYFYANGMTFPEAFAKRYALG
jgi:spore coat protein CotF